ncbi:MAG: hypothetical protein ABIO67_00115 [Mycobacteriales bacterium]
MRTGSLRLAAGTLALALPLAAAAGCGAEKKRTVKAEFASAQTNLESSKGASFTIRVHDAQGNLKKTAIKEGSLASTLADALVGASVTYTIDPAGDKTLKQMSGAGTSLSAESLKAGNLAFVIRDDKTVLGEIRVVAGVLYLHLDLAEIGRLAKAGGVDDFDAQLDSFGTDGPPEFAALIKDLRAGKWLSLDAGKYVDQLTKLGEGFLGATATPAPFDAKGLGGDLFAAVKPYVQVTDANDSSKDRVLDVTVQVRPALKAALDVLKANKDLPFASLLDGASAADIDKNITDGTAKGRITLSDGHLTSFSVDLESIRTLAPKPGTTSLAGVSVVVDVDDSADEVKAPTDVSSVKVDDLIQQLLDGFSNSGGSTGFGTTMPDAYQG